MGGGRQRYVEGIYVSALLSLARVAEVHVSPRVTTIMVNWIIFRATLGSFARCSNLVATQRGSVPRKPDADIKKGKSPLNFIYY